MTSSSPIGLEGSDLSSVNTMMSAVMSVGKVAENGGSPQSTKSPTKPPGPNRIGRRNQVSSWALAGGIWWLQSVRTLGEVCSLEPQLPKLKTFDKFRTKWIYREASRANFSGFMSISFHGRNFLCCGVSIGGILILSAL